MAQGSSRGSNKLVVPGSSKALDQMKYEIAAELGLPVGKHLAAFGDMEFATELGSIHASTIPEDYWGHLTTRDSGAVGGNITRRLVAQAQQALLNS
ncbi:MAG: alpha/beta-type small acid-soluble spore protein [Paenibacillaceae bacterium]